MNYPQLKKITLGALMAILCAEIFYFYISMLKASISTLSVILIQNYGLTAPMLSVIVSVFYITAVMLKLPAGVVVDRYGPKYPLIICVLITSIGVFWFSQATTYSMFLLSRAFLAVGYGCALLATVKIFVKYFPNRLYAFLIGTTLFCGYLGASSAGYPFARIIQAFPWSTVLLVTSMIGFTIAAILFISLDNDESDIALPPRTLAATFHESLLLLLNLRLLALACYAGIIISGAISTADLWGKLYLSKVNSISEESAAFASTTMIYLGIAIGSFLWGIIQSTFSCGRKSLSAIAIITVLISIGFFFSGSQSIFLLSVMGFLLGIFSAAKVVCYDLARQIVGYKNLAVVVGLLATFVTAMGAIIQLLIGYVFSIASLYFVSISSVYSIAVATIPVVLAFAAFIALFIGEKEQIS